MKRIPEQQRKKSPRRTPEACLENIESKPPKKMELKLRLHSHTSYHHKEKVMLLPSGGKLGTCKIVQLFFFLLTSNSHLQAIKRCQEGKKKPTCLIHKLMKSIAFLALSSVTEGQYLACASFDSQSN